jgi:negative regulator of replication initiation
MIHYAQSLLLAHLAEAAPQPIPMTPWWVVTFCGVSCTDN